MSLPETCPFCRAGVALNYAGHKQISDMRVVYECQTVIVDAHDRQRWQSDQCEKSQKAQAADRVRELAARVAELERELEQAKADRARAAMDARNPLMARVAELEAREKQAREDEAWASERTVLVEFHPVTSGWHAFALGVVKRFNAVEPTIHGALRALREKMEGGAR